MVWKQKKTLVFLAVIALAAGLLLTGCRQGQSSSQPAPAKTVTIKDDSGAVVTVKQPPKRIVSLTPNNTEILFALGLGDRVVGVTSYCDYPPEAKKKPKIGDLQTNVEKVVAQHPDLVVAKWTMNKDAVQSLRKLKIPVLCVEPESMDGVYRAIRLVGKATGTGDAAERVVTGMQTRLQRVEQKLKTVPQAQRPRVFVEVGNDPLYTAGSHTFINELLTLAGGVNIAGDISGYQMYSLESVVARNPDVILAPDSYYVDVQKIIRGRPGWSSIKAVRQGRIINKLDPNLINRPGPRSAQAVEAIARALYPDLFK